MDSRAFRLGLNDTTFFEVDKQGLFDLKEPLVADVPLQAAARKVVHGTVGEIDLASKLREVGFDSSQPSVWLMEGLLPYITRPKMIELAKEIGALSAPGSGLWGDGFSKTSVDRGIVFHGVPFESGFDDYDVLFREAGFDQSQAFDFAGISIDKRTGRMSIDERYMLTPEKARGRDMCLMVRAYKGV